LTESEYRQVEPFNVVKAHAYGNDFLLAGADERRESWPDLARVMCHRHHGVGADGVIFYTVGPKTATMTLFNADGSPSELSGNGLQCLGSLVAREQHLRPGEVVTVTTDAGALRLELQASAGNRYTFRTLLGVPTGIRQVDLTAAGETLTATVLGMGNPQCVVLGRLPDPDRFNRLGPALATHAMFPAGTNVEFAWIESPDLVRILIWERGVGPTTSSGTGTAAAAVAAIAHAGASRDLKVTAPGGTQRVEWRDEGVYLTGWAEIVLDSRWIGPDPRRNV
jgi:diaminopimelate epimerase